MSKISNAQSIRLKIENEAGIPFDISNKDRWLGELEMQRYFGHLFVTEP